MELEDFKKVDYKEYFLKSPIRKKLKLVLIWLINNLTEPQLEKF